MAAQNKIYSQLVHISQEFLGPAGERFIRRQIMTHLGIKPEQIAANDVPKLVNWVTLAYGMLTNNIQDINAFTQGLLSLGADQPHTKLGKYGKKT